jgi:molybdenum cofactor cytidylyltransferase
MNIAILILAAGRSSRMKEPKQLLAIGNKTLLEIAIHNALKSKAKKVFCVLGANAKDIQKSITNLNLAIIINSEFKDGLSTSIITGIQHLTSSNFDAVLIMLADQPNADKTYINNLIDTFYTNSEKIIASNYDSTYGVPAIFPKKVFKDLLKLQGDKGAKEFLNSDLDMIVGIKATNQLIDIDTKEDYLNYLKELQN